MKHVKSLFIGSAIERSWQVGSLQALEELEATLKNKQEYLKVFIIAAFGVGAPINLTHSSKTAYLSPRQKYVDNESELGVQQ